MYWLYGPPQFCNIDDDIIAGTLSSDQPIIYNCTSSQVISVSTIGSPILRYSTILSFNDLLNTAHMSADESLQRTSLLRNSVRGLVIMINRRNFTNNICLNSALVNLYKIEKINNMSRYICIFIINNIYYNIWFVKDDTTC